MWRLLQILTSAFLCLTAGAEIIPANRRANWAGNVGIRGGIPDSYQMQIYTNLPICSATAVSDAIANCQSNQVVQLTNGTYNLTASIIMKKNGVVLRGAGIGVTILDFNGADIGVAPGENNGTPGHAPANIVSSSGDTPTVSVNWTAGYTVGTTNITVASASGLAVGNFIGLDQLNDPDGVTHRGTECECSQCGRASGGRSQFMWATITAISNTTLTIDPPLFVNWNGSMDPEVWWSDANWLERSGVEELTIDGEDAAGLNPYSALYLMFLGYECWVKNVRTIYTGNSTHAHIETYGSLRCEFQGCEMVGEPVGSMSYGFAPIFSAGDLLANAWISGLTGPVTPGWTTHGLAVAYCYARNNYQSSQGQVNSNWNAGAFAMHDAFGCGWLVEGNYGNTFIADMIHGSGGYNTVFRNRLTGRNPGTVMVTHSVSLMQTNRHYNIVGNVLGTVGYHTNLLWTDWRAGDAFSIYYLGWSNDPNTCVAFFDPGLTNSVYIHQNYDTVTSTNSGIVWNTTNSDHTLPDSLLYASKPTQFGFLSWPPFDPANGSSIANNALAYTNIPAGYRWEFGSNPPAAGGGGGGSSDRRAQSKRATVGIIKTP